MSIAPNELPLQQRVNALRRVDNITNWFYLFREYLCLALVVGLPLAFFQLREGWGLSWWWNVPVTTLAIVLVGGLQHRLSALAHEAGHYMLFRHRVLNEWVSDWLCLFPLFSTTYRFRLQHLAHHQFVNDPERDPDLSQLDFSGHRFQFPMTPGRFLWHCVLKQLLWPPCLVLYSLGRAVYAATAAGSGPYKDKRPPGQPLRRVQGAFILLLLVTLPVLYFWGENWSFALALFGLPTLSALVHGFMPATWIGQPALKPDVAVRWTEAGRLAHLSLMLTIVLLFLTYTA